MDSEFDLALAIAPDDQPRIRELLRETNVRIDAVDRKGLDGHVDTIILILTGSAATLRAVAKILEEKYKAARSAEITVDGISIKGVSERAVGEVLKLLRGERKDT